MYARGTQFTWGFMVLAQLYQVLYNFVSIDKFNVIVAHAGLLQVWAYEKIVVVRLVGLQRGQEDPRDITVKCWVSRAYGYRYPDSLEIRRREIDGLHAEDLVWVSYANFIWDDDAHQLAWVHQDYFLQTKRKVVEPYYPHQVLRQFGIQYGIPLISICYYWYMAQRDTSTRSQITPSWRLTWEGLRVHDAEANVSMEPRVVRGYYAW